MYYVYPQNYRYLDLLNVLCVCDGVAIPDNQTYITEHWLRRDRVRVPPQHPLNRKKHPWPKAYPGYALYEVPLLVWERIRNYIRSLIVDNERVGGLGVNMRFRTVTYIMQP